MKKRIAEAYSADSPIYYICYDRPTFKEIHEPCHKLMYILEGRITMQTSQVQVASRAGEYMFAGKGDFSRIRTYPSAGGLFRMICFNITDKDVKSYLQYNLCPSVAEYSPVILRKLENRKLLDLLFSPVVQSIRHRCLPGQRWMWMKVQEAIHILTLTDKELSSFVLRFGAYPQKDLREYMEQNYMFNAPLCKFAEYSGRSLSTFRREFLQVFGTTPAKWLMDKRLSAAYRKMSEECLKPSAVYWEFGFETQAHFSRCFKQKYGCSPGKLTEAREMPQPDRGR
ncbi:MAG: AraC family transcriptional regulator [Bacteroides sp.]|nr:AraC family transcriptional regulator [Bacteroides sp.]